MLTLGRDRVELIAHRQRLKGQQSLSKWGEHLSALGVEQLVPHLRAIRRRIAAGKAGPSFALLSPLTHLPPQQVAATAARTVVDCISSSHTLGIRVGSLMNHHGMNISSNSCNINGVVVCTTTHHNENNIVVILQLRNGEEYTSKTNKPCYEINEGTKRR